MKIWFSMLTRFLLIAALVFVGPLAAPLRAPADVAHAPGYGTISPKIYRSKRRTRQMEQPFYLRIKTTRTRHEEIVIRTVQMTPSSRRVTTIHRTRF